MIVTMAARVLVFCFIVSVSTASLIGCQQTRWDVSRNARYHIGYVPGEVHALTAEVSVIDPHDDGWRQFVGYKPRRSAPNFLAPVEREWPGSIATLPAGTRLRIDRVERVNTYLIKDLERAVDAYATLLDSPQSGMTVRLSYVSAWQQLYGDREITFPYVLARPIRVASPHDAFMQVVSAGAE